jgi:hypothetical protein
MFFSNSISDSISDLQRYSKKNIKAAVSETPLIQL